MIAPAPGTLALRRDAADGPNLTTAEMRQWLRLAGLPEPSAWQWRLLSAYGIASADAG